MSAGKHPSPPADLAARPLPIREVDGPFFRIHRLVHDPLFFGTTGANRFDDPAGGYGVLYLGESPRAAFIETFGHETGQRLVSFADLKPRGMTRFAARRPLRVVELTGPNLARLGADAALFAGGIEIAQQWSSALRSHPDAPDGLRYPCRHDNHEFSIALFSGAAREKRLHRVGPTLHLGTLANAAQLAEWLDHYGFALLP